MLLSQKDAVYQATQAVLEDRNLNLEDSQDIREVIGEDMDARRQIRDLVLKALQDGQVALGETKSGDPGSMRAYATGLISNWFRKDRRLNGGHRYVPQIHKSEYRTNAARQNSSNDDRIVRFHAALDVAETDELKELLQEAIDDREDEIAMERDLTEQVRQGMYANDFEGDDSFKESYSAHIVDQENPPSLGSGHKGAVTDPNTDRRLRKNEDEQLHQSRVEAGKKGGSTVARERSRVLL